MNCRHCNSPVTLTCFDLGFAPPSNAYLSTNDLHRPETYFPLKVRVCEQCWLVQTEDYADAASLFKSDYAYFSSTSSTWIAHAKRYSEEIINTCKLDGRSFVVEIASNDGYLLKNFLAAGIPCLGIEPTASTAASAELKGIPVIQQFFNATLGRQLAEAGKKADLLVANNVFAHVPDINDFTNGLKTILKSSGVITLEFPHLMRLIENCQFDTVYHEHFSYLSLHTVRDVFRSCGLRIWNVNEIPTHGGSLRVFGCHDDDFRKNDASVENLLNKENESGLMQESTYVGLQSKADRIKNDLVHFLVEQKRLNKTVVAYGAAAKGNTLLNYAGVKPDLLPFICDAAHAKQGKYMPGSHIPIIAPEKLTELRPDYVLILPWNIATEIKKVTLEFAGRDVQYVTALPQLTISTI